MNLLEVEADVIAIADLDFDPPCEATLIYVFQFAGVKVLMGVGKPCGIPAGWIATCTFCGHHSFSCDAHKTRAVAEPEVGCGQCGATAAPASLWTFQRIAR